MRTEELDFPFDPALVATRPAEPRESARLLVVDRTTGRLHHRRIAELPSLLEPDDAIVVNTTSVAPARFRAVREDTGASLEGLLLDDAGVNDGERRAFLRNARRLRPGHVLVLAGGGDAPPVRVEIRGRDDGAFRVRVLGEPDPDAALDRVGLVPLPPYILRERRARGEAELDPRDRAWYATAFERAGTHRSVAAPTAGLHLTPELLATLDARGVERLDVELAVGPGTFKPVEVANLDDHPMHSEWCFVPAATLARLRARRDAPARRGRLVAIGTTSARTLESLPDPLPPSTSHTDGGWSRETDLLIAPGHRFRQLDGLLTNFHLPRSTLLALVGALTGMELLRAAYDEAVRERYRFYSYGDAMLIL